MTHSMEQTAQGFFEACEAGKGWDACAPYCKADASFSAQAEPLADVKTLEAYADSMKGLVGIMPDASYDLKSWAVDAERNNVSAYAVFSATHTGEEGRVRLPARAPRPTTCTSCSSRTTRSAT